MEKDGFTLVTRKSRMQKGQKPVVAAHMPSNINHLLKVHKEKLSTSRIYIQLLVKPFKHIVCFGLGSLNHRNSQIQLSLLILLAGEFKSSVTVYDPHSTKEEQLFLQELGFAQDECTDCCKKVEHVTLFYMVHCPTWMYTKIMDANKANLELVHIVGNSFDDIGLTCDNDVKLENDLGVFNNTSLHSFLPIASPVANEEKADVVPPLITFKVLPAKVDGNRT
jgi:SRR1